MKNFVLKQSLEALDVPIDAQDVCDQDELDLLQYKIYNINNISKLI